MTDMGVLPSGSYGFVLRIIPPTHAAAARLAHRGWCSAVALRARECSSPECPAWWGGV